MRKVWIEAALNGAWSRALQPGIPDTIESIVAEGVACARAGAAIIHTHAYDNGGPQTFDWQVYARTSSRVFVPRWTLRSTLPTRRSWHHSPMRTHHRRISRPASPISKPWQRVACSSLR